MSELEFDPFIAKVARELKEPVELDARFDARVMAALGEPEVIALDSRRAKLPWYRRNLAVPAPLAGFAAAAAFAGLAAIGILARQPASVRVVADNGAEIIPVNQAEGSETQVAPASFVFVAPSAKSVAVIGDFNDWQPTPMMWDSAAGAWSLTLTVPVGVHQYQFLVDDSLHLTDPTAARTTGDFGSANSIIKVAPRP